MTLKVGTEMCNGCDKNYRHMHALADMRAQVRLEIAKAEDEEALATWDAGKGTWPFNER